MITVKKINGKDMVVNCELIQWIEGASDTVIHLTTGEKLISADRPGDIVQKVIDYKKAIHGAGLHISMRAENSSELETVQERMDSRSSEL